MICTEESAQAVVVEDIAAELSDPALFKRLAPVYHRKYKPWKREQELGPVFRVIFELREATFKASMGWIFKDER